MKKTFSLLLIIFSFCASAQKEIPQDGIYFSKERVTINMDLLELGSYETEVSWMKNCMKQYHKERRTAYIMQFTGMIAIGSTLIVKDSNYQAIAGGLGIALNFGGFFTFWSAEKNLRLSTTLAPKK